MAAMKAWLAYACALLCVVGALSPSAFANDADARKQIDQLVSAYVESYKKQDAAGLAALYAAGGILVNPMGVRSDLAELYGNAFKAGFNDLEVKVDQVSTVGADVALAIGTYRATGKNPTGVPLENAGGWTATYVREGGKLKIRMLTSLPSPPPK